MKALKTLVVFMGVLIVVGTGVVAYTVVKRGLAPERAAEPAKPPAHTDHTDVARAPAAVDRLPAFGELTARLPPGYAPVEMTAEGDRLMVRLEAAGRDPRILVLDLRTGRTLGSIVLEREAAGATP